MAKEEKTPSRKATLHAQWIEAGKPAISKADVKAFTASYRKARAAKEEASKALEAAQAEESNLVATLILKRGAGRLRLDGEVYVPQSRGQTCYLRKESSGEVEDF